jgi:hypothetical protein
VNQRGITSLGAPFRFIDHGCVLFVTEGLVFNENFGVARNVAYGVNAVHAYNLRVFEGLDYFSPTFSVFFHCFLEEQILLLLT